MSNQLTKRRTGWIASLSWLVEPMILLAGCGLLVAIGTLSARLTGDNPSIQALSQRDDARTETDMLPWHPIQGQRLYVPAYSHIYHQNGETVSPLEYLEMTLHPWTAYLIMPVFALANAGVAIEPANLSDSVAIAVALGLVVSKPVGIVLFSWLVVRTGWAELPDGISWPVLIAGSCLAGIGFTMALFIDGLAFGAEGLDTAKTGELVGSAISAVAGIGLLFWTLPRRIQAGLQQSRSIR